MKNLQESIKDLKDGKPFDPIDLMNKTFIAVDKVNKLDKTMANWQHGLKKSIVSTRKATKSIEKGVDASKKLAAEMTSAVRQVASTGEEIYKEIELIIA